MFNKFSIKRGFTLVELMLVMSIFAIIITGVIAGLNKAYRYFDDIKLQVRATNFAREGVEMMFNIRDTNRRKYSGQKDKYWLLKNFNNTGDCFTGGVYALKDGSSDGNHFLYATGLNVPNVEDFYSNDGFWKLQYNTARQDSKIIFTGTYNYFSGDNKLTGSIAELLGGNADFYRIVRVFGIYEKNVSDTSHSSVSLDTTTPKEMRFCVKVFYKQGASSELCSIMTNFEE